MNDTTEPVPLCYIHVTVKRRTDFWFSDDSGDRAKGHAICRACPLQARCPDRIPEPVVLNRDWTCKWGHTGRNATRTNGTTYCQECQRLRNVRARALKRQPKTRVPDEDWTCRSGHVGRATTRKNGARVCLECKRLARMRAQALKPKPEPRPVVAIEDWTCKWGHTGRAATRPNGTRYCRECRRISAFARYHRDSRSTG